MKIFEGKKYYSIREVAGIVDRSYTFVRTDIANGKLEVKTVPITPDINDAKYNYFIAEEDIPAYKEMVTYRAGGWKIKSAGKKGKKILGPIKVSIPEDFNLDKLTKPYYGTAELAEILGWKADRVATYATKGILKADKIGTYYIIMKEDIGPFVEKIKKQLQKQEKAKESTAQMLAKDIETVVFTNILNFDISTLTEPFYALSDLRTLFGWTYIQAYWYFVKSKLRAKQVGKNYIITKEALIEFIEEYQEAHKLPAPAKLFAESESSTDYFIECKTRRVQLIIQPSLYDELKERADAEHDSVNNLVVRILKAGVKAPVIPRQPTIEEYVQERIANHFKENTPLLEQ